VVKQTIELGSDGGAVAEQFLPVFQGEECAGSFMAAHDDLPQLFSRCGP
jgi:hypothetical protein